jgi:hypothetical protein
MIILFMITSMFLRIIISANAMPLKPRTQIYGLSENIGLESRSTFKI